jgi:microcystin-dependent protein
VHRWVTPEAAAGDYACRRFSIPVEMLHIVLGALQALTYESSYEALGTMTPAEAAALMQTMLDTYQTTQGDCMIEVGTVVFAMSSTLDSYYWHLADGTELLKADYPELWARIDGDAVWETDATHFILPDLIERFALGTSANIGDSGGEETHTLTTAEMPAHTHTYVESDIAASIVLGVLEGFENDAEITVNTGSTGGGDPHNNMPPYQKLFPYVRVR